MRVLLKKESAFSLSQYKNLAICWSPNNERIKIVLCELNKFMKSRDEGSCCVGTSQLQLTSNIEIKHINRKTLIKSAGTYFSQSSVSESLSLFYLIHFQFLK